MMIQRNVTSERAVTTPSVAASVSLLESSEVSVSEKSFPVIAIRGIA